MEEALHGVSSILLDTAPVIYHLERSPIRGPLMEAFFRRRDQGNVLVVTSPVTLAECLVHPVQRGLAELEDSFRRLIMEGERTLFHPIGAAEATTAALLRARYNLRLADAFQAAVAIEAGCQAILTNDVVFKRLSELRALVVDELQP